MDTLSKEREAPISEQLPNTNGGAFPVGMAGWRILQGDAREVLATLPERSVHAVITSPPYW